MRENTKKIVIVILLLLTQRRNSDVVYAAFCCDCDDDDAHGTAKQLIMKTAEAATPTLTNCQHTNTHTQTHTVSGREESGRARAPARENAT